jgi:hypothetical protein
VIIHGTRADQRGALATECIIALAILVTTAIPLSLTVLDEMKLCRAYYYHGAAMELIDGEMEVLLAGEKTQFGPGENDYQPRGRAVTNLPSGKFKLTVLSDRLRLDWTPTVRNHTGKVSREVRTP